MATTVSIGGRPVDVKRAVPEGEMESTPSKIFVGGLHQKVDRDAIKEHFSKYGEVRDAVVMMDRSTGRSRGFGFVRFASSEAATAVLAEKQVLEGLCVDVKRAEPAAALPPPKYPRSREEQSKPAESKTRRSRKKGPADSEPDVEASANAINAAVTALLANQMAAGAYPAGMPFAPAAMPFAPAGVPFAPFGMEGMQSPFGMPGMEPDFASLFNASLFGSFPPPVDFSAANNEPSAPLSPFGDLSNIIRSDVKHSPSPPLPLGVSSENLFP